MGEPSEVKFVSRRSNLFPLDESPFVNEYFTPDYVRQFSELDIDTKDRVVSEQKLSSDGITASLLDTIYCKLYSLKTSASKLQPKIMPSRTLKSVSQSDAGYKLELYNNLKSQTETVDADLVILATGFDHSLPPILKQSNVCPVKDHNGNIPMTANYEMSWDFMAKNHIYMQNFGRNTIGISEPQTSLMAWRSANIINHLLEREYFNTSRGDNCFLTL